jgi:hypothetical protein
MLMIALVACSPAEPIGETPIVKEKGTEVEESSSEQQATPTETPQPTATHIEIDGEANDWMDRPLLYEDAAGDAEDEYLDFTQVYAFLNRDALYILVKVVDSSAPFVQIDVELSADNERTIVSWRQDVDYWKAFPRSQFALGSVLEGRIDLRDIGYPEQSVVIYEIRAMVGDQASSKDWWAADSVNPLLQRVVRVNEFDLGLGEAGTEEILDSSGQRVNFTTSGYIDKDEIWRDEIHVTGDIEFLDGAVLTIEPGTIVYIASNSDDRQANDTGGCYNEFTCLYDDPTTRIGWGANTISIDGRDGVINAEGTQDAPIIIQPEGDSTSTSQYGTILVQRGLLKYVKILYSDGVEIIGPTTGFEIAYSEIRYCISNCLSISQENTRVHHSIIEGGGNAAFRAGNHSVVDHNTFLRSNVGILVPDREDVILRNNLIFDCSTGIAVSGRDIEVSNNTIAYVEGPPEGIYYENELVYPLFNTWIYEFGIGSDGNVRVINNIIAAPYPNGLFSAEYDPRLVVKYNLVWEVDSLAGGPSRNVYASSNFKADPLFADLENWDVHLLPGSPAIDAGFPDLLDPDGTLSDIGAYGGPFADEW